MTFSFIGMNKAVTLQ